MHSTTRRLKFVCGLLTVVALGVGCSASIQDGDAGVGGASGNGESGGGSSLGGGSSSAGAANVDCSLPSPGTAPLRRLSNAEYGNTLSDLFASVTSARDLVDTLVREFPAEPESLGFRNNAEFLTVQGLTARKYSDAAEALAEKAAASAAFVGCTPTAGKELDCARSFIADFGSRAYRRALTVEESARYEAQFQKALTSYDFATGVEWTTFSVLQSPAFLYRVERGQPSSLGFTPPTPDEMASRLSYLFWQSQPDSALSALARSGGLAQAADVEAQARRMLADPRSDRLFQYFTEWLDLDRLQEFSRDPQVFAALPSNLPSLYQSETRAFVSSVLRSPSGSLTELLTAPYTYANASLASFYGLNGVSGTDFVRVADERRSGVLTQAFLAAQDKPYRTSIVRRGLKVRTDLLCQNVPAPPNDVQLNLEASGAGLSQRARLEQHRKDPSCAGCHSLLDPIGIVFENFDAVGRYRGVDEAGEPVTTNSEVTSAGGANGRVANVRDLGALLAGSREVQDCYVTQTFRFFFGRDVEPADSCSLQRLRARFQARQLNLAELLVALTQTDAFLYRPTLEVRP